ncbi:MAG: hypothetical protein CM1200mP3_12610 [Chloroflexota bacterium]|nr:MAG: hypothetical protein CM1200mP3_12610 [Chloroflexota bacterium]
MPGLSLSYLNAQRGSWYETKTGYLGVVFKLSKPA